MSSLDSTLSCLMQPLYSVLPYQAPTTSCQASVRLGQALLIPRQILPTSSQLCTGINLHTYLCRVKLSRLTCMPRHRHVKAICATSMLRALRHGRVTLHMLCQTPPSSAFLNVSVTKNAFKLRTRNGTTTNCWRWLGLILWYHQRFSFVLVLVSDGPTALPSSYACDLRCSIGHLPCKGLALRVSLWDQVSAGIIATTEHISKASWISYYIFKSPPDRFIRIITKTMRFLESFVLVIIVALIASVSASDAATEHCPTFCLHDRHCKACPEPKCVSNSCSGFNYMTHWRGIRNSLCASSIKQCVCSWTNLLPHEQWRFWKRGRGVYLCQRARPLYTVSMGCARIPAARKWPPL